MEKYHVDIDGQRIDFRSMQVVVIQKPSLYYGKVNCVDGTLETAQKILEQRFEFNSATLEKLHYIPHPNVKSSLAQTGLRYIKKTDIGFVHSEIDDKSRLLSQRLTVRGITLMGLEIDVQRIYNEIIQLPEIAETLFELGQASRLPVYSCENYPHDRKVLALEAGEIIRPEYQSLSYLGGRFLSTSPPELVISNTVKVNDEGFLVLDSIDKHTIFFSEDEEDTKFYKRLIDFRLSLGE